ncbi:MinD/ParA family ATP-binding protein [Solicola gregarius]|uniref:MinD-like ATPase involved in chromosome partitioning or flagellar assembly n=1 Tax=Solicola gregarius TaxID=2908642 RepID=A0AA46TG34_9ACTN|nr:hypothetical protein [Solicola gregarius]UYM04717.1 hypothetical protein L0C25_19595 [Solicola gregarius]
MSEGREADVAPFPVVVVTIDDSGVAVNGEIVERDPDQSPREAAIDAVSRRIARALGRPVRTVAEDYTGRTRLVVHPDGHVSDVAALDDGGAGTRQARASIGQQAAYAVAARNGNAPESADSVTGGGLAVADRVEDSDGWQVPPSRDAVDVDDVDTGEIAVVEEEIADDYPSDGDAGAVAEAPDTEGDSPSASETYPVPADVDERRVAPDSENPWADQDGSDPFDQTVPEPDEPSQVVNPWITAANVVNGGPGSEAERQRARRKSFIAAQPLVGPAQMGVRGALTRMGMRTHPSRREMTQRESVRRVSQHWPGPRTIAIANPKGSANKTPTMICLSAVFGRFGGAGVLGWDNNETRGTAAWRTHRGPHVSSVLDLLPRYEELLGARAQAAQLARYVHHQATDKFDVLWSDQSTEGEHEMTGDEVDRIHEIAAKYYRLILMDSGNSERASNWRAMIAHADQLVVPCTNVEDTAEAGARMLEALAQRDEHSAALAKTAVAVVSQRTPGRDANMERIVNDFRPLVRDVVAVPHDPALYSGVINFDALHPRTRRAWLDAASAVATNL